MCIQVFPTQSLFGRPTQREVSHFYIYLENIFLYYFYLKVVSAGSLFLSWQKKTLKNQWCFWGGLTKLPAVLKVFSRILKGSLKILVPQRSDCQQCFHQSQTSRWSRTTDPDEAGRCEERLKKTEWHDLKILLSWIQNKDKIFNVQTELLYYSSECDVCNMFGEVPLSSWWFYRWNKLNCLDSVCLFLQKHYSETVGLFVCTDFQKVVNLLSPVTDEPVYLQNDPNRFLERNTPVSLFCRSCPNLF